MKFTSEEMAAIVKMCNEMVLADGRIDARETDAIEFEFKKLGITTEEAEIIYTEAYKMDAIVACSLIRDMDDEKKKEVTAFIGAISASDEDLNEKEIVLWSFISKLCNLPTMSIAEAITIFGKNYLEDEGE